MTNTCMMHFLLALFILKSCIHLISIRPYFCVYVFIIITINRVTIKFIKLLTLSHILVPFFNSSLSVALKDIVLSLSKYLTYPIIWGSFIHNCLMTSSSLYPMKHLSEFFVPYDSFFEINILSKLIYLLNSFLFL